MAGVAAAVLLCLSTKAQSRDGFVLADTNGAVAIFVSPEEHRSVQRVASDLAEDVFRVSGKKPAVINDISAAKGRVVVIGTVGVSKFLDALVAAGILDVSSLRGQWESSLLQVVDPVWPGIDRPGVDSALVIAGSDRRGAIYGAYEVSEMIGVSPWYWWADVAPQRRSRVAIPGRTVQIAPPAVKYRGIFLNDEDWGLQPWAAKTFEPETGDIGPKTYARIFELLLRLRGNFIWPAMHPCTRAFNAYPANKDVADAYGIVMGSSHCEQMLCNNVDEWKKEQHGEYNYVINRDGVLKYWARRVEENGRFENVYTLGMRGIHDSGMPGGGTQQEQAARLQQIIRDQRDLLQRSVNSNLAAIPQIFCPYKEVLDLYRLAPDIPSDITLVWPDDNYGYIRQFSSASEQRRSGGAGVYYHISYWGRPYDYLWLHSTSPALVREEMTKAYDYGARTLWVANVGDIKPAEIGMEFFLKLAWNPDRWRNGDVTVFLRELAARDFGREHANDIAAIWSEYFRLNFQRKTEHMGLDSSNALLANPVFSVSANGDEAGGRLKAFQHLRARAETVARRIPAPLQDAFFELVLYPVRGAALMNEKGLRLAQFRAYSAQGRAGAATALAAARKAHESIQTETATYNERIAGGKWKQIISANPRRLGVFGFPNLTAPTVPREARLGIAVEGRSGTNALLRLPEFNALTRREYFVDVFNHGSEDLKWTAKPDAAWIQLSRVEGTNDQRVWVSVDWGRAPVGDVVSGAIQFSGAGRQERVELTAFHPDVPPGPAEFVEDNRRIVMEAEHPVARTPGKEARWELAMGLGYNGQGVTVQPSTAAVRTNPDQIRNESPCLQFRIWVRTPGTWKATVRALPTFSVESEKPQRYAIAIDDETPRVVSLPLTTDERNRQWQENVLRNAAMGVSSHQIATPGVHTLKLWMVDPGIVVDTIFADAGSDLEWGYLGPAETLRR